MTSNESIHQTIARLVDRMMREATDNRKVAKECLEDVAARARYIALKEAETAIQARPRWDGRTPFAKEDL